MKKHIYSFFLVLIFLLSTNCYIESATIKVGNINVLNNQTSVSLPIQLTSEDLFAGYQLTITYNKDILKISNIQKGNVASNFSLQSNLNNPGQIGIISYNPSLKEISGNGVLLYLNFNIIGTGNSPIRISNIYFANSEGKKIQATSTNGQITVGNSTQPNSQNSQKQQPENKPATISPSIGSQKTSSTANESMQTTRENIIAPTPLIQQSDSFNTDNFLLFVQSEYGITNPQQGYTTFKKGTRVFCKAEKEVFINEMEKAVCVGFIGKGSVAKGNSNTTSFNINSNSTLTWLWQLRPTEKDFILEFNENFEIEEDLKIIVKAKYFGGLNSPIELRISNLPKGISVGFEKTEISYKTKEQVIVLKTTGNLPAGEYKILINAICNNIQKDYETVLIVKGRLKQRVMQRDNNLSFSIVPENSMELIKSFQMQLDFQPDKLSLNRVAPNSIKYKLVNKNVIAFAGEISKNPVNLFFNIIKPSDFLVPKIKSFTAKDTNGKIIPVIITE
ncbi:cohesin domain-containing protein [bacterium]|nr:cohesin domain-containing protein [bacterium]